MKIKEGFVLRQVAGSWVVLTVGQASVNFNKILSLNESGVLLWRALEKEGDRNSLTEIMLAEYDVDEATARAAVERFVAKLESNGFLE